MNPEFVLQIILRARDEVSRVAEEATRRIDRALVDLNKTFDRHGATTRSSASDLNKYSDAVRDTSIRLENLKRAEDEAKQSGDRLTRTVKDLTRDTDNLATGTDKIRQQFDRATEAQLRLRRESAGLSGDIDRTEASFRRLGRTTKDNDFHITRLAAQLRGLRIVFATLFAQPLISALVALAGAFAAVASSAVAAASAVGATFAAAVNQAIPTVGLLVAVLARMTAIIKTVSLAEKEQEQASFGAAQQQEALARASEALVDAQERLGDSLRNQREAVRGLGEAREEAKRQIQDLILAEREADLAAQGASLSQVEAQQRLQQAISTGAGGLEVARAQLGVEQAGVGVQEAGIQSQRAREAADQARQGGVAGMDVTISAQRRLAEATRDTARAERDLQNAREALANTTSDLSATQRNLQIELAKLSGAEREAFRAIVRFREEYRRQVRPITDIVVNAITDVVDRLTTLLSNPVFRTGLTALAQGMATAIRVFTNAITSPEAIQVFGQLMRQAAQNMPLIARAMSIFAVAFARFSVASGPFLTEFLNWVIQISERFDRWTRNTDEVSSFLATGRTHFQAWKDLAAAFIDLVAAIGGAGLGSGLDLVTRLTGQFREWARWIRANREEVKEFFDQSIDAVVAIGRFIGQVAVALVKIFDPASVEAFANFLSNVVVPVIADAFRIFGFLIKEVERFLTLPVVDTLARFVGSVALFAGIARTLMGVVNLLILRLIVLAKSPLIRALTLAALAVEYLSDRFTFFREHSLEAIAVLTLAIWGLIRLVERRLLAAFASTFASIAGASGIGKAIAAVKTLRLALLGLVALSPVALVVVISFREEIQALGERIGRGIKGLITGETILSPDQKARAIAAAEKARQAGYTEAELKAVVAGKGAEDAVKALEGLSLTRGLDLQGQMGGTGAARPGVSVAAGANRPGAGLTPQILDIVQRTAQVGLAPLTVTTGTRHSQLVAGTSRESAHWRGNAVDIAATGERLVKIGQDALIAAGMSADKARQIKGGLFNINGYQVIFNTMEGGDHTNHLHIGVSARQAVQLPAQGPAPTMTSTATTAPAALPVSDLIPETAVATTATQLPTDIALAQARASAGGNVAAERRALQKAIQFWNREARQARRAREPEREIQALQEVESARSQRQGLAPQRGEREVGGVPRALVNLFAKLDTNFTKIGAAIERFRTSSELGLAIRLLGQRDPVLAARARGEELAGQLPGLTGQRSFIEEALANLRTKLKGTTGEGQKNALLSEIEKWETQLLDINRAILDNITGQMNAAQEAAQAALDQALERADRDAQSKLRLLGLQEGLSRLLGGPGAAAALGFARDRLAVMRENARAIANALGGAVPPELRALFPALGLQAGGRVPGGKGTPVLVGEGGYEEYIISTDPKHRSRSLSLISDLLTNIGMGAQAGSLLSALIGAVPGNEPKWRRMSQRQREIAWREMSGRSWSGGAAPGPAAAPAGTPSAPTAVPAPVVETESGVDRLASLLSEIIGTMQSIKDLEEQKFQEQIDGINKTASQNIAINDVLTRIAEFTGNTVEIGRLQESRESILQRQLAGLRDVLARGPATADQAFELQLAIKGLELAILELSASKIQVLIDSVNKTADQGLRMNDILIRISEFTGNTSEVEKLRETREGILQTQLTGFRDLLAKGPVTGDQAFELQLGIKQLELALLELTDVTSKTQSFTSRAWEWFRVAIFTGAGALLPRFQIPALQGGGEIIRSGLAYVHAGETVVPSGQNAGAQVNLTINEVKEKADPVYLSRRLAFELSGRGL